MLLVAKVFTPAGAGVAGRCVAATERLTPAVGVGPWRGAGVGADIFQTINMHLRPAESNWS